MKLSDDLERLNHLHHDIRKEAYSCNRDEKRLCSCASRST